MCVCERCQLAGVPAKALFAVAFLRVTTCASSHHTSRLCQVVIAGKCSAWAVKLKLLARTGHPPAGECQVHGAVMLSVAVQDLMRGQGVLSVCNDLL